MAPHKVRDKLQKTRIDSKKLLTMAELLEQSGHQVKSLHRNQEVDGKIIGVTPTEILVDIGAKSEGIIAGHELTDAGDLVSSLTVGDNIKRVRCSLRMEKQPERFIYQKQYIQSI